MFEGSRYQATRSETQTQIAARIRADLKAAQTVGELPGDVTFSVRSDRAYGIGVQIRGRRDAWIYAYDAASGLSREGRLSAEARALLEKVEEIHQAYNYDRSDTMTDYFDRRYYGQVQYEDEQAATFRAKETERRKARAAVRKLGDRLHVATPRTRRSAAPVTLDGAELGTVTRVTVRTRAGGRLAAWLVRAVDGAAWVREDADAALLCLLPDTRPARTRSPRPAVPAGPAPAVDVDQAAEPAAGDAAEHGQDQAPEQDRRPVPAPVDLDELDGLLIEHTPAEGTLVHGTARGDGSGEVLKAHGLRWSRYLGAWFVRSSRNKYRTAVQLAPLADALRAAGFAVTVRADNQARATFAQREAEAAERAEARADRYAERAEKATRRAEAHQEAADRVWNSIPAGQPMLVDHYSYAADRNRRDRAHRNDERAWDERKYARHLANRADAAEAHQQHRNNPRVTQRRIETLEAELRGVERSLGDQDNPPNAAYRERLEFQRAELVEQLDGWRAHLAQLVAAGEYLPWGPEHFTAGDLVDLSGLWVEVVRVNPKSVTVYSVMQPADNPRRYTNTVPYDKITGRQRDGVRVASPAETEQPASAGANQ